MCEAGDVLGWRVDGDPVLPYDSMDDGLTRISRSPILKPDLGRTEPFPFSVARTYSIQVLCCLSSPVTNGSQERLSAPCPFCLFLSQSLCSGMLRNALAGAEGRVIM